MAKDKKCRITLSAFDMLILEQALEQVLPFWEDNRGKHDGGKKLLEKLRATPCK